MSKLLSQFCQENNFMLRRIRYRHQFGYVKRKGFDIVSPNGFTLIELEPCDYSNGDKWFVRGGRSVIRNTGIPSYTKRISKSFINSLKNELTKRPENPMVGTRI